MLVVIKICTAIYMYIFKLFFVARRFYCPVVMNLKQE